MTRKLNSWNFTLNRNRSLFFFLPRKYDLKIKKGIGGNITITGNIYEQPWNKNDCSSLCAWTLNQKQLMNIMYMYYVCFICRKCGCIFRNIFRYLLQDLSYRLKPASRNSVYFSFQVIFLGACIKTGLLNIKYSTILVFVLAIWKGWCNAFRSATSF